MIDVRRHNPAWDILSFVLHVLLFAVIVFCTPVREIVLPKPEPEPQPAQELSPEKLEKLDSQLAEARKRELERDIDTLQTVLNDMDVVRDQLRQDFDDVVRDLAADAKEELRKVAEEARKLQEEVLAKQDEAAKAVEHLTELESGKLDDTAKDIADQANHLFWNEFMQVTDAQAKAQNALDRIETSASFANYEKVAEAAKELREAQVAASKLQASEAKDILEPANKLWEFRYSEDMRKKEEAQAASDRKEEATQREKKATAESEKRQAAEKRDDAEKRRAELESKRDDAARERDAANREKATAENDNRQAEARKRDAENRAKNAQNDASAAQNRAKQAAREETAAQDRGKKAETERAAAQERADKAAEQQKAAQERAAAATDQNAKNAANRDVQQAAQRKDEATRAAQQASQRKDQAARDEQQAAQRREKAEAEAKAATERADEQKRVAADEGEKAKKASAEAKSAKDRADAAERTRADEQRKMEAARAERDRFENDRRSAERRENEANTRMERFANYAAEHEKKAKGHEKRMEEMRQAAAQIDKKRQNDRQAAARKAQQDVLDAMAKLDAAIETDVAKVTSHIPQEFEANELSLRDVSNLSVSEAYEFAKDLEEAVTESYREVVAASTALTQHLSLEEAERLTDVAKPIRDEIDAELLDGRARTAEALAAQKEARYKAVRETENMVDSSMSMMDEAFRIAGFGNGEEFREKGARQARSLRRLKRGDLAGHGNTPRADRFIALAGLSGQLESAAAENSGMFAKDLTALTSIGGPAQFGGNLPEDDYIRAAGKKAEKKIEAAPPGGSGDKKGQPGTGRNLLPGNILSVRESAGGRPGGWMYLLSWWVIGPFPNPDRINITRKFPPESVVDLDAAYEGAGGLVRWQFVQARNGGDPRILYRRAEVSPPGKPEYTIWYGWTQIVTDDECDVWLAAGSDDRSDVWVNGMKVWASGNNLKEWSINEGYRKVHLRKGANEVLLRLENGHGPTGFSVCISPNETPPAL